MNYLGYTEGLGADPTIISSPNGPTIGRTFLRFILASWGNGILNGSAW